MTDKAVIQIQETLAFQDQQLQDLNDVVIQQGKMIDALKRHITKLEDKIEVLEDDIETDGETKTISDIAKDNKPPHY